MDVLAVPLASPVGLAAKCRAFGYPRSRRRATKHGSDPVRLVADVIGREVLDSIASATRVMSPVAAEPMDVDDVRAVMATFVDGLARG